MNMGGLRADHMFRKICWHRRAVAFSRFESFKESAVSSLKVESTQDGGKIRTTLSYLPLGSTTRESVSLSLCVCVCVCSRVCLGGSFLCRWMDSAGSLHVLVTSVYQRLVGGDNQGQVPALLA